MAEIAEEGRTFVGLGQTIAELWVTQQSGQLITADFGPPRRRKECGVFAEGFF
jgi:hypothetical protein